MALVKAKQIAGGGTGGGVTSYNDLTDKPTIPQSYNDLNDLPTLVSDYSDLANTPPLTKSINFFGTLEPTAGTAKFAFPQAVTITKAYAVVGVASTSIISAILYKNGQSFAALTIDANAAKSSVATLTEAISANDFLTADIAAASGGENLILILEYQ